MNASRCLIYLLIFHYLLLLQHPFLCPPFLFHFLFPLPRLSSPILIHLPPLCFLHILFLRSLFIHSPSSICYPILFLSFYSMEETTPIHRLLPTLSSSCFSSILLLFLLFLSTSILLIGGLKTARVYSVGQKRSRRWLFGHRH